MKYLILLLITLITFTDVSYASFPVLPTEQTEISIYNITYQQAPWYISVKNVILFLATCIFGFAFLSLFITEVIIEEGSEGPVVLLALLLATASFFGSVFFGKKIWGGGGNFRASGDRLAKKILIWIVPISIVLFLFLGLTSIGSGMGG